MVGRPKGSKGRTLAKARGILHELVERKAATIELWLDEVYHQDGPAAALKLFIDIAEFTLPKLARTELTGLDGKDLQINWPLPLTRLDDLPAAQSIPAIPYEE